jgi:hypothetical protein
MTNLRPIEVDVSQKETETTTEKYSTTAGDTTGAGTASEDSEDAPRSKDSTSSEGEATKAKKIDKARRQLQSVIFVGSLPSFPESFKFDSSFIVRSAPSDAEGSME